MYSHGYKTVEAFISFKLLFKFSLRSVNTETTCRSSVWKPAFPFTLRSEHEQKPHELHLLEVIGHPSVSTYPIQGFFTPHCCAFQPHEGLPGGKDVSPQHLD